MTPAMQEAYERLMKYEALFTPHPSGIPVMGWMDDIQRDRDAYRQAAMDFWAAAKQYAQMRLASTSRVVR